MRSGNPVLKSDTFDVAPEGERMTLGGTVNKTAILLALVLITAMYTWGRFYSTQDPAAIMPLAVDRRHRRTGRRAWSPYSRRSGPASPRLSTRCSRAW